MQKIFKILKRFTGTRKRTFQDAIDQLFDKVYVISLPESVERRDHIRRHFDEIGLTRYQFVDALSSRSAEVKDAFEQNIVARYPVCFRCKKFRCGKDTCNNVLIPPQVANFLTYRELWQRIAQHPQRALLVEDDVVFEPYAEDTLRQLFQEIESGKLEFVPDKPRLLRLGWAQCKEHHASSFRLDTVARMSNPCHAMTSAFAQVLLDRFEKIDTTSDVFIHGDTPKNGEATTVFPPIAAELSWSTGAMDSLIHPKEIRSAFLRERGRDAEAVDNDKRVLNHIKHMHHYPLVILGHPGGMYAGPMELMAHAGLQIGKDKDGQDGLLTWSLATDADRPNPPCKALRTRRAMHWNHLLHLVERPEKAVPEIMAFIRAHPELYRFIRDQILEMTGVDLEKHPTEFEKAVLILVTWSEFIDQMHPALTFRAEDSAADLVAFLTRAGIDVPDELDAMQIAAAPENGPCLAWDSLPKPSWERLVSYCRRYGYSVPAHSPAAFS
ncbi:Glycosyltransferase family 25 (LPS biosynthesis protein) [Thalassovita gelatinovora]|uniref:Glycosyltransferase family 25 (LPS biosynthesis protein) n=1 Tax=Thalassovita gelatinovora TaxID=53501 RepID=A0A0N7LV77_THAGE|nr:glycosyltransferase family 25 protein [Thalassovita gelatinovora]QIZ80095.1 glycosyltransferase family 25 protein [Thalassovita gelatinovora]CUH65530.1 Glycosyltransferase family 25 (LPS biosynthesis protein) [Thalassovita gelatinovora]SER08146.1 Glycosyltransferase involved in LPS biosynthesis, GR25 family [Thalassovita gelatinovora]